MTIVDEDPVTAPCDARTVAARLFAVFDTGVTAEGRTAFNDNKVVMVRCFVIFGG
ncbi:MAG TPA: hypothetical protein VHV99_09335 [Paraburkholderia sp.]|nr:hypothetical protein [Paraburkholderia sp.]